MFFFVAVRTFIIMSNKLCKRVIHSMSYFSIYFLKNFTQCSFGQADSRCNKHRLISRFCCPVSVCLFVSFSSFISPLFLTLLTVLLRPLFMQFNFTCCLLQSAALAALFLTFYFSQIGETYMITALQGQQLSSGALVLSKIRMAA